MHTYNHTHAHIQKHTHTHIHTHANTHTHPNLQSFVVREILTCTPSGTYGFWGRKESLENHTWAFPASTQK